MATADQERNDGGEGDGEGMAGLSYVSEMELTELLMGACGSFNKGHSRGQRLRLQPEWGAEWGSTDGRGASCTGGERRHCGHRWIWFPFFVTY